MDDRFPQAGEPDRPGDGDVVPRPENASGEGAPQGRFRILVVAAQPMIGEPVLEEIRSRAAGRTPEVRIVSPALTESRLEHYAGNVDEAIHEADDRLTRSIADAESKGIAPASGAIGDSDPMQAISDTLQTFEPDEILVVTHARHSGRWLEDDLFELVRDAFEHPVAHFVVDDEAGGRVEGVERAGPGRPTPRDEVGGRSPNIPALARRDALGLFVAIVGSVVLVILAADCVSDLGGSLDAACIAALLVAGAMTLINLAHAVALTLFESVGYRGVWQRFFALATLLGTPAAIVAVLVLTG